jgi:hypothetical protein
VIFAMSCLSPVGDSPGLKTRPPCAARERTFCLLSSVFCLLSSLFRLLSSY